MLLVEIRRDLRGSAEYCAEAVSALRRPASGDTPDVSHLAHPMRWGV